MAEETLFDSLRITPRIAVYHGRFGPVKVFGDDVDERAKFSEQAAHERFNSVWHSTLLPQLRRGQECSYDTAVMRLPDKQRTFLRRDRLLWEFEACDLDFIAQIEKRETEAVLDQVWYVPSVDSNPKLLRVVFDTVEERKAFGALAARLGWNDQELGLALVRDFAAKLSRLNTPPRK